MTRISFIPTETLSEPAKTLLQDAGRRSASAFAHDLMRALAHTPDLLEGMRSLDDAIRDGLALDPQLRELAALQVLQLNRCELGFKQHMAIAKSIGLNDKQIANVGAYRTYPYYSDAERLVLEYAETVTLDLTVPGELFRRVQQGFGDREIVELTVVIAYCNMLSRLLVPLGIADCGE